MTLTATGQIAAGPAGSMRGVRIGSTTWSGELIP